MSLTPTIEALIALTESGSKGRIRAAKNVRFLPSVVDLDRLIWLIDILTEQLDSEETLELSNSLSAWINKAAQEIKTELLEKLVNSDNIAQRWLAAVVLGRTINTFSEDFAFEVIRRLIKDSNENVRFAALMALKEIMKAIPKEYIIDILEELLKSEGKDQRAFLGTILVSLSDSLQNRIIEEFLWQMLDADSPKVILSALESIKVIGKKFPKSTLKNMIDKVKEKNTEPEIISELTSISGLFKL